MLLPQPGLLPAVAGGDGPGLQDLRSWTPLDDVGPYLRSLAVQADTGTFAIEAVVPATGFDLYSARYSSRDPGWRLEAPQAGEEEGVVPEAASATLRCSPAAQGLSCR